MDPIRVLLCLPCLALSCPPQIYHLTSCAHIHHEFFFSRDQWLGYVMIEQNTDLREVFGEEVDLPKSCGQQLGLQCRDAELAHFERSPSATVKDQIVSDLQAA